MKRGGKVIRILLVLLVLVGGFAVWAWFRPYEWNVDGAACCRVVGVQVREDHGYFWVEPHLKLTSGKEFDLEKPIRLVTRSGMEFESAGTTFGGSGNARADEVWLKFWVERKDLEGGLNLKINGGHLILKSSQGSPRLGSLGFEYFTSSKW